MLGLMFVDYDSYMYKASCGFNKVDCPNAGCVEKVIKAYLKKHLNGTCPRRVTSCYFIEISSLTKIYQTTLECARKLKSSI